MTTTSFNGGWTVKPRSSFFAEAGESAAAVSVSLPHDAMLGLARTAEASAPSGYFPSGEFEYSKTFEVPAEFRSKRVSVQFHGVYRDAMVYVNGVFAAQRPSGYSTFTVPLDPYLRYGEPNTIRVESREHRDSRWYSGAGIHRDTLLIVTELVHVDVDGLRVTTPDIDEARAVVEAAIEVRNEGLETRGLMVTSVIRNDSGAVVATGEAPVTVRAGAAAVVRIRHFVSQPQLWGIDDPALYTVSVRIAEEGEVVDEQSTTFGIRRIQVDPARGLRINGETVKLRGACIHHDNGILGAATIGRAEERRVQLLKEAGFNAIRSAHNPISQPMLDACDRLGMIVMDETFDMWTEAKSPYDYALSFPEWWERDIEAFIAKDHNHPSVVFYSIGNEIPETGTLLGSEWSRKLAEKIRALDPTRLITNGINGFVSVLPLVGHMMAQATGDATEGGVNTMMNAAGDVMNQISASELVTTATAEAFSVLDVAGINYGDGRYVLDRHLFPNRVIVGTETFPAHIDVNWKLVQENPHVIGDFTWTGWDYLGEAGIGRPLYLTAEKPSLGGPYPWLAAWCGDIDITGHRRPASFYREIVFGLRHEPYIAVRRPQFHGEQLRAGMWSWSDSVSSWSWSVDSGSPITVEVYSDADEVELLINGFSVGRTPVGADHRFRAEFETTYQPGELVAVAYVSDREVARTRLCTASDDVHLTASADRSTIVANDRDLSFITIDLRDEHGVLINDRDRLVTVRVAGAGRLQGYGSARPDPSEGYHENAQTSFDGRLLAIVRPDTPGEIRVTIESEGLDSVTVLLTAVSPDSSPIQFQHKEQS